MMAETLNKKPSCWVCSGNGMGLCPKHLAEADDRAAKYNISRMEAVSQLRQIMLESQEGA